MSLPATGLALRMAKVLEDAAQQRGCDYATVAHRIGVKPHYVRRVFKGDVTASLAQLERLAAAIGCAWQIELITDWAHKERDPSCGH